MRRYVAWLSVVTGLGWTAMAASGLAWVLGALWGWAELFYAAACGILMLLLASAFTFGRTNLLIAIDPQRKRMEVGQSTEVDVLVTNVSRYFMLPLALEVVVGDSMQPFDLPRLPANGGWKKCTFNLPGTKRGVIALGPATTVRGDPFGLLQRRVAWTGTTEVFVHPLICRLRPLGNGLLRDLEGLTTNDLSMSDLAFHTLREYVPGDDRRYIHWRSSAKVGSAVPGGKFLIRQFRDTRRTHLLIVVDGDPASYAEQEEFEIAISAGASVAVQAVEDALDATLIVADQWSRKENGLRPTRQLILDRCSRAQLNGAGLAGLVAQGMRLAPDATFAVLVTGANTSFLSLRRVTTVLPVEVRATAVRVDLAARPALTTGPALSVLTLAQLRDLRPLLSRGGTT